MKVKVNGIAINYRIDGVDAGDWVTLVPGVGNDITFWDALVPVLEKDFRVLRYDPRGQAGSDIPPGPYSLDDAVGDVTGLVSLDLASNGEEASATARVRIPLGGAQ